MTIPFLDVFAKALTLTIASEMAIYLDKYHNTVIGRREKKCGERKGGRETEKEERKKEKEE